MNQKRRSNLIQHRIASLASVFGAVIFVIFLGALVGLISQMLKLTSISEDFLIYVFPIALLLSTYIVGLTHPKRAWLAALFLSIFIPLAYLLYLFLSSTPRINFACDQPPGTVCNYAAVPRQSLPLVDTFALESLVSIIPAVACAYLGTYLRGRWDESLTQEV